MRITAFRVPSVGRSARISTAPPLSVDSIELHPVMRAPRVIDRQAARRRRCRSADAGARRAGRSPMSAAGEFRTATVRAPAADVIRNRF
jgi:hypothetical protein